MNSVQAAAYSEGFEAGKVFAKSMAEDEVKSLRSQLEEAKDLAELFEMLCKQLIRDERISNFEELHGLAARARSFLSKETGNG